VESLSYTAYRLLGYVADKAINLPRLVANSRAGYGFLGR